MDILKFTTAGSVDDGKSTLIGRLLYETGNIKDDILQSVSTENDQMNLAYITDGLRAERTQGITIDVAYKYFSTPNRKYVITDAPGHFQYTKNLVTGASGVEVMIILIDAQNGITEQTKRHSQVAAFLRMKHVVVAVNKMDAVGYDKDIFYRIIKEYQSVAKSLSLDNVTYIPISALNGDNISKQSRLMPWYEGITLLYFLENYKIEKKQQTHNVSFIVQCTINSLPVGYAGKLLNGTVYAGDRVFVFPYEEIVTIEKIVCGNIEVKKAVSGENISIYLSNNKSLKRGDMIASVFNNLVMSKSNHVELCWLDTHASLKKNAEYIFRINAAEYRGVVTEILHKINADTFDKYQDNENVCVNEFAKISIELEYPIIYDLFTNVPENGRGIIIDPITNNTAGAFIII